VTKIIGLLRRDTVAQLHFHLQGILAAVCDAQQPCDTNAMGITDITLFAVDVAKDQIGGLAAYTGQTQQILHVIRNFAVEAFQQHLGAGDHILCLGAPKAAGMDILAHLLHIGLSKCLKGRKAGEQGRGNQINPGVGTLGSQTNGEEQFIVLTVIQRALGAGIELFQSGNDFLDFGRGLQSHHLADIIADNGEKSN